MIAPIHTCHVPVRNGDMDQWRREFAELMVFAWDASGDQPEERQKQLDYWTTAMRTGRWP